MHTKILCIALFVLENEKKSMFKKRREVKIKAHLCSKIFGGYFKCQFQRFSTLKMFNI